MGGIAGPIVVRPVAVHALRRQPRVYAAGVACRARLGGVNAHKRVRGVREGRVTPAPIAGTMALGAVGGEARRSVIGTLGALVVGQVTADAIGGRPLIDTVGMAARALERGVDSHEMKRRVIEPGLPPRGVAGEVAHGAVGGEARRHVIRVPGPAVVLSVAGVAVRADRQVEAAGRMAADASHGGVLGADGEPGVRLVVPGHGGPRDRPVAVLALVPQPGPERVVLTPDPVTVEAAGGRALDDPVPVTVGAGDGEMAALEGEEPLLVEGPGGFPEGGRRRMARRAVPPEVSLVRVLVTARARGRDREVRPCRVALLALLRDGGVTSHQGEAGLLRMVEVVRVEGEQIGVAPTMLRVAHLAVPRDLPVHAPLLGHAFGDGLVAGQALRRRDAVVRLVALLAVGGAVQHGMDRTEWPGRGRLVVARGACRRH